MLFDDRFDAAYRLVPHLKQYADNPNALVLAIPRGGLQLGSVLAQELRLPLDVIFTKKIGYPGNPEYAIGAVSLKHIAVAPDFENIPELQEYITHEAAKIRSLLRERAMTYRGDNPPLNLAGKIVIVVDDGVATGNTLLATLALIAEDKPQKIIVALPVAPREAADRLRATVDELICLQVPDMFLSVGQFYKNFEQVDDQEAIRLLREARS